jgi:dCTP deaminase
MILSNAELHKALDDGRLVITPEPKPRKPSVRGEHCPFDTHSIDLRLADEIVVPSHAPISYNLSQPGSIASLITNHSKNHKISEDQPFNLKPNLFVLGKTLEHVHLPISADPNMSLAARIEGKSSRARLGLLVHFTAPTVHPGFQGTLTLEMINLGPVAIQLFPGMAIAQLIVEEVKGVPDLNNPSSFQGQSSAAGLLGNGR